MLDSITEALTATDSATSLVTVPETVMSMGFALLFGLMISLCYLKTTRSMSSPSTALLSH